MSGWYDDGSEEQARMEQRFAAKRFREKQAERDMETQQQRKMVRIHEAHMDAAEEMYEALHFIKNWFQQLEDNTDEDDPLKTIRKRMHAPIHKVIDAAFAKADIA